jgi:hypothetical protein
MWKAVLAGTTALTLIGGSLLYAQQTPPTQPGSNAAQQRPRLSPEDRAALTDARIAGLKAGLKLTSAQEKNWPAVEAALRDRAKLRADRFEQFRKMREQRSANPTQRGDIVERMRSRADNMATSAASMKKLADAMDPLYKSLDDGQKQRFALLYRAGGEGRHHFGGWRNMGPEPQMGPAPATPDRRPGPRQRRTENSL